MVPRHHRHSHIGSQSVFCKIDRIRIPIHSKSAEVFFPFFSAAHRKSNAMRSDDRNEQDEERERMSERGDDMKPPARSEAVQLAGPVACGRAAEFRSDPIACGNRKNSIRRFLVSTADANHGCFSAQLRTNCSSELGKLSQVQLRNGFRSFSQVLSEFRGTK